MAFAASVVELQEEALCSLCLDYLRNPVTVDCGHNFCGYCIHKRWRYLEEIFPCPLCLHHCLEGKYKPNAQLCRISDIIKELPPGGQMRKEQDKKPLCEKHNEVLDLFCEEDWELLCPQCVVSPDHQDHWVLPIESASVIHIKKLKKRIALLQRHIEIAEKDEKDQVTTFLQLYEELENWGKELQLEITEFKFFLRKEQVEINARLSLNEKDVQEKVTQTKNNLLKHRNTLKNLLTEIQEKILLTDRNVLESIKNIYSRYTDLSCPAVSSYEVMKESYTLPPHYFGLHKMISTFLEELTLDPETAHLDLIISEDRKSVTFKTSLASIFGHFQTFTPYIAVLGREGFDRGRHFWQVEICGSGVWFLGVCKETFCRNTLMSPTPANGCWSFEMSKNTSPNRDEEVVRIGIFLDYELGELSVYNLNSRSYLYKFTDSFSGKLMPYFAIGPASKLQINMIMKK